MVTAVDAERRAVLDGLSRGGLGAGGLSLGGTASGGADRVDVIAAGVGSAAAAAGTARALTLAEATGRRYSGVLSAGIGGGFVGVADVGGVVLGTASVAADLGADSPDGFLSVTALGFGTSELRCHPGLLRWLRERLPAATAGPVLTVSTVTGTADGTARIRTRHPDAAAEAMEGFGVATAAALAGVPFGEVRAISNVVGPRDRAGWRIPDALAALAATFRVLATVDS